MLVNKTCSHLCTTTLLPTPVEFLSSRIREGFSQQWLIDGLPAAEMRLDDKSNSIFYSMGFALGNVEGLPTIGKGGEEAEQEEGGGKVMINNHFEIYLEYHDRLDFGGHQRVVGVVVWPTR